MVEHGWALKSKRWPQVVGLMNTAYGHPKTHPLPYVAKTDLAVIAGERKPSWLGHSKFFRSIAASVAIRELTCATHVFGQRE